jgi:IclR family transcriptional regulator, KDG regulon repressor
MENISKTVNKALDVLEIFLQKDGDLRLAELAGLTGLDRATTYRLTSTLVKRRFLHQTRKNGKYSLGLKMIDCSFAIRRNLKFIDLAYLYLGKLNTAHNTAVNLTILDEDKSLVIEEIGISSGGLPNISKETKRLPLHATACGKILLASMTVEERKAFYRRNVLKPYTEYTNIDAAQLEKELEDIRKEEIAFDMQDYKMGLWTMAVPVYDGNKNVIAAASVIIPQARTDRTSMGCLANALKNCAGELSKAIKKLD